jgi:hypothetical protein
MAIAPHRIVGAKTATDDFANRPGFFVIGAQRSGTTRLCHLLDQHPEVSIPSKEPFYFHTPEAMLEKRDWYRSLFANATGSIFGEGSTYYSMAAAFPGTAGRIHTFNPEARIIYLVRHPLRRIESAWHQLLFVGHVSGLDSFKKAVMRGDELVDPSLYWRQLSEYRRVFPDDQIRVITFEDFVADEKRVLDETLDFLGAAPNRVAVPPPAGDRNASEGKTQQWLVVDAVKALPGYRLVKHLVPQPLKTALTNRLQKPIRVEARWDKELVDHVVDRVSPDSRAMLDYMGLPHDYWDLADVEMR